MIKTASCCCLDQTDATHKLGNWRRVQKGDCWQKCGNLEGLVQYLGQRQSRALRPGGRGGWLQNQQERSESSSRATRQPKATWPGRSQGTKTPTSVLLPPSPGLLWDLQPEARVQRDHFFVSFLSFFFLFWKFSGTVFRVLFFFFLVKVLKKFCKAIDLYALPLNPRDSFVSPGITSCKLF